MTPPPWHDPGFAAAACLVALVVCACLASHLGRIGAVALGVASFAWLATNSVFEGGTLVFLSWTHGVNTTDLAGVFGLGYAVWLLLAPRRRE